jgi:hypothetical protein
MEESADEYKTFEQGVKKYENLTKDLDCKHQCNVITSFRIDSGIEEL